MNRATTMRRLGADVPYMKERITLAFRAMRKQELLARQNLPCCLSCASERVTAMLDTRANRKNASTRLYDGYVFYHAQDREAIQRMFQWYGHMQRNAGFHGDSAREAWNTTILHLAFGNTADFNPSAQRSTADVGRVVVACLDGAGIVSEWDGDPDVRIAIPLMQDWMDNPNNPQEQTR